MYKLMIAVLCLIVLSHSCVHAGLGSSKSLIEELQDLKPQKPQTLLLNSKYITAAGAITVNEIYNGSSVSDTENDTNKAPFKHRDLTYAKSHALEKELEESKVLYCQPKSNNFPFSQQTQSTSVAYSNSSYVNNIELAKMEFKSFQTLPDIELGNIDKHTKIGFTDSTDEKVKGFSSSSSSAPVLEQELIIEHIRKQVDSASIIDLSMSDNESFDSNGNFIELHSRKIDLHPVYDNNPRKCLRQKIYERQRHYHHARTVAKEAELKKIHIITGTGRKRSGPYYTLQNAVKIWLEENYCKRRIESIHSQEGFITIILRKNIQSIK